MDLEATSLKATEGGNARPPLRPINCDQVAWIGRSLECLLGAVVSPTATHMRTQGAKVACLIEIMDALGLGFENEDAAFNATENLGIKRRMASQ